MKYVIVRNCIYAPPLVPKEVMLERWDEDKCLGVCYLPRHFTQIDIDNAVSNIDKGPERATVPRG